MTLEEFARRLGQSRAIVFFTGAGISTESGVPDFRSPGGVWSKYQPVLFQDFLASESARVQHWQLKKATYELFKTVKPNSAHYAICEFEKRGQLLGLITQNIDGLHKLAGASEENSSSFTAPIASSPVCNVESVTSRPTSMKHGTQLYQLRLATIAVDF